MVMLRVAYSHKEKTVTVARKTTGAWRVATKNYTGGKLATDALVMALAR